jgi:hypothetical protein
MSRTTRFGIVSTRFSCVRNHWTSIPNKHSCIQHRNKAVADGAVSFYLDHFVSARIAKNTDGVKVLVQYQPQNAEHRTRSMSLQRSASGEWEVPNGFSAILQKASCLRTSRFTVLTRQKNTRVSVEREFRQSYHLSDKMPTKLGAIKLPIYRYSGVNEDPQWIDTEPGKVFLPEK